MKAVALMLMGFLNLSGCGLVRDQMAKSELDRFINERNLAVESNRELDPIRGKVWMGGFKNEPPLSMLTLSEKATDTERPAIAKWHEIVIDHKAKFVALVQKYYPLEADMTAGMTEAAYANLISLIAELYSQNLTYGQYNKRGKEEYVKFVQQLSAMKLERSRIQAMWPPTPKTSFWAAAGFKDTELGV